MIRTRIGMSLAALLFVSPVIATEPGIEPAKSIVKQSHRLIRGLDHKNIIIRPAEGKTPLLINRRDGHPPNVNSFESHTNHAFKFDRFGAKMLVIYRSGKLKGTGVLVTRYRDPERNALVQLWLPRLRKIRRIATPDPADYWQGSVFTFDEVFMRRPEDQKNTVIGMERLRHCIAAMHIKPEERGRYTCDLPMENCEKKDKTMYWVRSRPVGKSWYDRQDSLIDPATYAPVLVDYFKDGEKIKTIQTDWQPLPGGASPEVVYPHFVFARSHSEPRESMIYLPPEVIAVNQPVKVGFWSDRTLRKIRR